MQCSHQLSNTHENRNHTILTHYNIRVRLIYYRRIKMQVIKLVKFLN